MGNRKNVVAQPLVCGLCGKEISADSSKYTIGEISYCSKKCFLFKFNEMNQKKVKPEISENTLVFGHPNEHNTIFEQFFEKNDLESENEDLEINSQNHTTDEDTQSISEAVFEIEEE